MFRGYNRDLCLKTLDNYRSNNIHEFGNFMNLVSVSPA